MLGWLGKSVCVATRHIFTANVVGRDGASHTEKVAVSAYRHSNSLARDFLQRSHIGQKTTPGIAVVQPLLLRHIAQNAAESDARCGLAAPEHLAGIWGKTTSYDMD